MSNKKNSAVAQQFYCPECESPVRLTKRVTALYDWQVFAQAGEPVQGDVDDQLDSCTEWLGFGCDCQEAQGLEKDELLQLVASGRFLTREVDEDC
jgi:hypothetical protein